MRPEDRQVSLVGVLGGEGQGRGWGWGRARGLHGHQGLVLLVEEAEVLGAAGLVGDEGVRAPVDWQPLLTSGTVLPAPSRLRAATGPHCLKRQLALGDPGVWCNRLFAP